MVRLGRQADDQIETVVFEFIEGMRLVFRNIDADFIHGGDRERIEFAGAQTRRSKIDFATEQVTPDGFRHRRTHCIMRTRKENGLRPARRSILRHAR